MTTSSEKSPYSGSDAEGASIDEPTWHLLCMSAPLKVTTLVLGLLTTASACSTANSELRRHGDSEFARALATTATVATVAKRGARVCREMRVGIAERDWVRGVVVEAEGRRVRIRIEDPGQYEHLVGGATAKRGAVVEDDAASWTPCLGSE